MMKGVSNVGGKGSKNTIRQPQIRTTIAQKKGAGMTKDAKAGLLRNDTGTGRK